MPPKLNGVLMPIPTRLSTCYFATQLDFEKALQVRRLNDPEQGRVGDNVTLIKGNLAEEIPRLKQQPGKNIGVAGSSTLVRSLLQSNLLDELTLMVHPVVAGRGKRLFKDGGDLKRLKLVDSKTTRTGVSILTYQPDNK